MTVQQPSQDDLPSSQQTVGNSSRRRIIVRVPKKDVNALPKQENQEVNKKVASLLVWAVVLMICGVIASIAGFTVGGWAIGLPLMGAGATLGRKAEKIQKEQLKK